MKLIHVSDLHIKAISRENETVRAKLAGIRSSMGPGDLMVVTGDVTDSGTEPQYRNALELLKPFAGHLAMCPGNHDFGLLGNFYDPHAMLRWAKLCKQLSVETLTRISIGDFLVGQILALDTCLRTGSPVDFAQGLVGFWQRRAVKKFAEQMERCKLKSVVILHHNVFCNDWYLRLQDAKKFLDLTLGRVDYVLMGHEHKAQVLSYPTNLPENQTLTQLRAAGALNSPGTVVSEIQL